MAPTSTPMPKAAVGQLELDPDDGEADGDEAKPGRSALSSSISPRLRAQQIVRYVLREEFCCHVVAARRAPATIRVTESRRGISIDNVVGL